MSESISYTSRDQLSIYNDLVSLIPSLAPDWTSREETDPGIVLIKLMAALGDNLSYMLDKSALEVYPTTVTQRSNAYRLFNLLGYKMKWYRTCRLKVGLSGNSRVIPALSEFGSSNPKCKLTFYNLSPITISNEEDVVELVEGTPISKEFDYKIDSTHKYEIPAGYRNVDPETLIITYNGMKLSLVDRLAYVDYKGYYYEFLVDENDRPYIEFTPDFEGKTVSINMVLTSGAEGSYSVSSGYIDMVTTNTAIREVLTADELSINAIESTDGSDPETVEDARIALNKYVNTFDTLVTLDDYTKAALRVDGVANAIAKDVTNDGNLQSGSDKFRVNLYIAHEDNSKSTELIERVSKYIDPRKVAQTEVTICSNEEQAAKRYYNECRWSPQGTIYLYNQITPSKAESLLSKINYALYNYYRPSEVSFNTAIDYIGVIDTIMSVDSNIKYVDLDPLTYDVTTVLKQDSTTSNYNYIKATVSKNSNYWLVTSQYVNPNITLSSTGSTTVDLYDTTNPYIKGATSIEELDTQKYLFNQTDGVISREGANQFINLIKIVEGSVSLIVGDSLYRSDSKGVLITDDTGDEYIKSASVDYTKGQMRIEPRSAGVTVNVQCNYGITSLPVYGESLMTIDSGSISAKGVIS